MGRIGWSLTVGLATGLLGIAAVLLPVITSLEESIGRSALFISRGTVRPPDQVVLVSIDEAASVRTGLPPLVRDWPRLAYVPLVKRLVDRGAAVIGFDIQFFKHGDSEGDQAFADVIASAGRVVLIQRIERSKAGDHELWERQDPIPELAQSAVGLAAVPMPDVPVVSWTWSFLPMPSAGEIPTLPAVLLQLKALPASGLFVDILNREGFDGMTALRRDLEVVRRPADLLSVMQRLREQNRRHPSVAMQAVQQHIRSAGRELAPEEGRLLLALADLYGGSDARHLNFYGPPGTICTLPYDAVVEAQSDLACRLEGAVVLVGLASTRVSRAGQMDSYHTVYGAADGIDFSGVEIHATAVANLLTGTSLLPAEPAPLMSTLILLGTIMGAVAYWVRTRKRWSRKAARSRWQATGAAIGVALIYTSVVVLAFRFAHIVLPLIVPLALQLPAAVGLALLVPAFRHREEVRAVCLATDAAGSTAVGQRIPHGEYAHLMDAYRQLLVSTVLAHEGEPIAPEGDGLVCVWCCPPAAGALTVDESMRLSACRAAVDIMNMTERFNREQPVDRRLPTRIGLNAGVLTIHSDADRGVFEVFGDVVNVAAKLRDLNRELDTHVLATAQMTDGLDSVVSSRQVSSEYTLKGVTRTPALVEILNVRSAVSSPQDHRNSTIENQQ